jgi:uncharacterized protein (TIGR00266 family)
MSSSVPSILRPSFPTATTPRAQQGATRLADVIDYRIQGTEMQFVEIELDPGESVVAEAGAMMMKDAIVHMDTIFGDGSKPSTGFFGKLAQAGKRVLTGESLFMTVFTHQGQGKARVSFAAPYPGSIIPFALPDFGGSIIAQRDSFLCAAKGISIGIHFQQKLGVGIFGGQGFIMQKIEGDGLAFIHGGGTLVERDLAAGEQLDVDTGSLAAMTTTIQMEIQRAGSVKSMVFGGEGLFFIRLTGPGRVWLQSLPFSRLAGRMLASMPRAAIGGSAFSSSSSSDGGWFGGGGDSGGDSGGGGGD